MYENAVTKQTQYTLKFMIILNLYIIIFIFIFEQLLYFLKKLKIFLLTSTIHTLFGIPYLMYYCSSQGSQQFFTINIFRDRYYFHSVIVLGDCLRSVVKVPQDKRKESVHYSENFSEKQFCMATRPGRLQQRSNKVDVCLMCYDQDESVLIQDGMYLFHLKLRPQRQRHIPDTGLLCQVSGMKFHTLPCWFWVFIVHLGMCAELNRVTKQQLG